MYQSKQKKFSQISSIKTGHNWLKGHLHKISKHPNYNIISAKCLGNSINDEWNMKFTEEEGFKLRISDDLLKWQSQPY